MNFKSEKLRNEFKERLKFKLDICSALDKTFKAIEVCPKNSELVRFLTA
ncbi:MAG: hypothetical protein ACPL3B_01790 [Fervidobacterium sp.]|jgi:hypothetical protein